LESSAALQQEHRAELAKLIDEGRVPEAFSAAKTRAGWKLRPGTLTPPQRLILPAAVQWAPVSRSAQPFRSPAASAGVLLGAKLPHFTWRSRTKPGNGPWDQLALLPV
jgi:hypothetical protein